MKAWIKLDNELVAQVAACRISTYERVEKMVAIWNDKQFQVDMGDGFRAAAHLNKRAEGLFVTSFNNLRRLFMLHDKREWEEKGPVRLMRDMLKDDWNKSRQKPKPGVVLDSCKKPSIEMDRDEPWEIDEFIDTADRVGMDEKQEVAMASLASGAVDRSLGVDSGLTRAVIVEAAQGKGHKSKAEFLSRAILSLPADAMALIFLKCAEKLGPRFARALSKHSKSLEKHGMFLQREELALAGH